MHRSLWVALLLTSTACVAAGPVKVVLKTSTGQSAGTVTFKPEKRGGVQMKVDLENLPVGDHAVHLHESAKCDVPDFRSAGPHFNPTGKSHGFKNPNGHHAGDTPMSVQVGEDHRGSQTFVLDTLSLDAAATNSIFANGGTSVVVHERADDQTTDPSGNSGNRIACGIVLPQ